MSNIDTLLDNVNALQNGNIVDAKVLREALTVPLNLIKYSDFTTAPNTGTPNITINENNGLVIKNIKGEKGEKGDKGIGIQGVTLTAEKGLDFTLTDNNHLYTASLFTPTVTYSLDECTSFLQTYDIKKGCKAVVINHESYGSRGFSGTQIFSNKNSYLLFIGGYYYPDEGSDIPIEYATSMYKITKNSIGEKDRITVQCLRCGYTPGDNLLNDWRKREGTVQYGLRSVCFIY